MLPICSNESKNWTTPTLPPFSSKLNCLQRAACGSTLFMKRTSFAVAFFLGCRMKVIFSGDIPLRSRYVVLRVVVRVPEFEAAQMEDHNDEVLIATRRKRRETCDNTNGGSIFSLRCPPTTKSKTYASTSSGSDAIPHNRVTTLTRFSAISSCCAIAPLNLLRMGNTPSRDL